MRCRAPSLQAFGGTAGGGPGCTVGFWPLSDRKGASLLAGLSGCNIGLLGDITQLRSSSRLGFGFHQLPHQIAKHHIRVQGPEPAVEVDCSLDIAVAQHAPNGLVIARMRHEPHGCGGMTKLMRGNAKAGGLFNPFGDLPAEGLGVLAAAVLAGK
jgi:hypothetical protein